MPLSGEKGFKENPALKQFGAPPHTGQANSHLYPDFPHLGNEATTSWGFRPCCKTQEQGPQQKGSPRPSPGSAQSSPEPSRAS